ncbi:unnamed protein product [Parascedosporium putredinis]|uniref:Alpha/beta-hydrolase n=1 Tax=Parascedosporium putredinis TaxID=1442378 RepID=A0A9P1M8P5_9PEZI|nr:unnamed protein product [Parascedosporium putredinis]CAI7993984.1 unnamed protein product [Parascedosporium putredinis]
MFKIIALSGLVGILPLCAAQTRPVQTGQPGGTGPYPASWTTDFPLTNHTIFAPVDPPANLKLPVIVWGQTGCSYDALRFEQFLIEVASQGVFIIANGTPDGSDNPNGIAETQNPDSSLHLAAIDWVTAEAGSGAYVNVDASRLAAAGQSCGGVQAYSVSDDERVTAIGIFNSGMINANDPLPTTIDKPIFYFLGGPSDIAYANGERDYVNLPADTPKWKGNLAVGHMGTYAAANGGKFGVAASHWARWILRGDAEAAGFFTGSGTETAEADGWEVVHDMLDAIEVESWDA